MKPSQLSSKPLSHFGCSAGTNDSPSWPAWQGLSPKECHTHPHPQHPPTTAVRPRRPASASLVHSPISMQPILAPKRSPFLHHPFLPLVLVLSLCSPLPRGPRPHPRFSAEDCRCAVVTMLDGDPHLPSFPPVRNEPAASSTFVIHKGEQRPGSGQDRNCRYRLNNQN